MPKHWTDDDDELRLVLMLGLRKGLAAVRGARRAFSEERCRTLTTTTEKKNPAG